MKIFILGVFYFLRCFTLGAQEISTDSLQFNPNIDSVAEKLVAMAMINARISGSENVAGAAEYEFKRARTSWLNNVAVAGNLNELSLKQGSAANPLNQSTQFPRYNIGVVIPLGLFINNGKQTRAAYYRYEAAADNVRVEQQNIRKEVLIKYEDYLMNKQLLALQQSALQDAKILLSRHEEKFAEGNITLEQYTATNKQYNSEKVRVINLIRELKVIVAELEALIGMNIEVALDQISRGQGPASK